MDSVKSRVAYLQGMMDGLAMDNSSKEGKIITEVVRVLDDIADRIDELQYNQKNLEEYINALDFNLQDVEDDFYGYEDYDDFIYEDDFIEFQCPGCTETIYIDKSIIDNNEQMKCPNCNCNLIEGNEDKFND